MPPPPSLCGSFLTNKRSLVAFTWTLTTVLTLIAFVLAIVMMAHVHTHYVRMERYYVALQEYNHEQQQQQGSNDCGGQEDNQDDGEDGEDGGGGCEEQQQQHGSSDDAEIEWMLRLGHIGSSSMPAVAVYTAVMALALSLYGSTTIVGFTSMRGVYIAPCFSPDGTTSQSFKIGMFGGAIVLFANVLMVCAIVLGEVRVEDWSDQNGDRGGDGEENNNNNNNNMDQPTEPYEIERIATILAVTCMFLAPLYILFAGLLLFYFGDTVDATMDGQDFNYHVQDHPNGAVSVVKQAYQQPPPIQANHATLGTTIPRIGTDPRSIVSDPHHHHHHHRQSFLGLQS